MRHGQPRKRRLQTKTRTFRTEGQYRDFMRWCSSLAFWSH